MNFTMVPSWLVARLSLPAPAGGNLPATAEHSASWPRLWVVTPRALAFKAIAAAPEDSRLLPASPTDVAMLECEQARTNGIATRALEEWWWVKLNPTLAAVEMRQFNFFDGWRGQVNQCERLRGEALPLKAKATHLNPDGSVSKVVEHKSWQKLVEDQRRAKLRKQIAARRVKPESIRVYEEKEAKPVVEVIAAMGVIERRETLLARLEADGATAKRHAAELLALDARERSDTHARASEAELEALDLEIRAEIARIEERLRNAAKFDESVDRLQGKFPGTR